MKPVSVTICQFRPCSLCFPIMTKCVVMSAFSRYYLSTSNFNFSNHKNIEQWTQNHWTRRWCTNVTAQDPTYFVTWWSPGHHVVVIWSQHGRQITNGCCLEGQSGWYWWLRSRYPGLLLSVYRQWNMNPLVITKLQDAVLIFMFCTLMFFLFLILWVYHLLAVAWYLSLRNASASGFVTKGVASH